MSWWYYYYYTVKLLILIINVDSILLNYQNNAALAQSFPLYSENSPKLALKFIHTVPPQAG